MTHRTFRALPLLSTLVLLGSGLRTAQADGFPWRAFASKTDDWYRGDEGARFASMILSNQSPRGDWPKNFDTSARKYEGDPARIQGTFDNGATVGETRFLARAYRASSRSECRDAVIRSLDHILAAQYPTGGWPQSSPPGRGYPRHITFNDDTMVNLMELARDASRSPDFAFLDESRRVAAGRAFDAGILCILKCQIKVGDRLTSWCAQHDETTLEPRGARAFELVSLSGSESAGILRLLMSLERPGPDVVKAVESGVAWFEASKLTGIRQITRGGDKVIVADPGAPPLWARFYEVDTNRPFFCGRDGVKKYQMVEIEAERRNGYAWYGTWGADVAARYSRWKRMRGNLEGARE